MYGARFLRKSLLGGGLFARAVFLGALAFFGSFVAGSLGRCVAGFVSWLFGSFVASSWDVCSFFGGLRAVTDPLL